MFIVRVLASIAFVFLPFSATAQITLSPDDLRPFLGMTWEQEIATVLSSLEDSNFDIGSAGADQSSDLTGSISNSMLAFVRSSVISLEQVLDAASFTDADYSVISTRLMLGERFGYRRVPLSACASTRPAPVLLPSRATISSRLWVK